MIPLEVIEQTQARFAERQTIRQEIGTKLREGAVLEADSPERVRKRIQRVAAMVIATEGVPLPVSGPPTGTAVTTLERIMGKNDLMSIRYLELGLRTGRTVARVHVRAPDGSIQGYGTGFLVSPRLLLTNNHVLTDATVAGASRVEFDFQEGSDGRLENSTFLNCDPSAFFVTDRGLDFSLVALKGDLRKLASYGWNGLSAVEGKIIVGEYVTIIQHPSGERKQVALRENRVVDVLDNFLHYQTDTSPGSSGSPVFNDQWEIVALHHSGVPKKDAQGRILARDGRVYTPSMGDGQIDWIANEGVRVSQIIRFLQGLGLGSSQAALRRQMLESEAGWQPGPGGRELDIGSTESAASADGEVAHEAWVGPPGPADVASPSEWLVGAAGARAA